MMVDSDDLISNRIAEYCNSHPGCSGFLSKYGYVYNEGLLYVKKLLAMHMICGSCSIVNYSLEDLPEQMPEDLWDDRLKDTCIIRMSHRKIPDYLESVGRKLEVLPFPSTIYVRNTCDNHSMLAGGDLNWKRKAELMIREKSNCQRRLVRNLAFIINKGACSGEIGVLNHITACLVIGEPFYES